MKILFIGLILLVGCKEKRVSLWERIANSAPDLTITPCLVSNNDSEVPCYDYKLKYTEWADEADDAPADMVYSNVLDLPTPRFAVTPADMARIKQILVYLLPKVYVQAKNYNLTETQVRTHLKTYLNEVIPK